MYFQSSKEEQDFAISFLLGCIDWKGLLDICCLIFVNGNQIGLIKERWRSDRSRIEVLFIVKNALN